MNPTETLEAIMKTLTKEGYSYQISKKDLEKAIIQNRGIDVRTIDRWIQLLEMFGFIGKVTKQTWEINITKLNIVQLLKNKPQTHIG